jgi:hypothetical protein
LFYVRFAEKLSDEDREALEIEFDKCVEYHICGVTAVEDKVNIKKFSSFFVFFADSIVFRDIFPNFFFILSCNQLWEFEMLSHNLFL